MTQRTEKPPFSGHLPALDGVRGLAILMVLILHFLGNQVPTNDIERLIVRISGYGALGVDLFFVLSGFLITGILYDSKNGPHYFKNFYMRRLLRIFPLYYGTLAIIFLLLPHIPMFQGPTLESLQSIQSWAWLYAMNIYVAIAGAWTDPYITHFWSLAVEEHFYLFFPFLVYYLTRKELLFACLIMIGSAAALREVSYGQGLNDIAIYALTPFRLDGLCIGAMIAIMLRGTGDQAYWEMWLKRTGQHFFLIASVSIAGVYIVNYYTNAGKLLWPLKEVSYNLAFAAILIAAITSADKSAINQFFTARPMLFLGKYSYGLYVFHAMVSTYFLNNRIINFVLQIVPNHLIAMLTLALFGIFLSVVISYGSYHLFEKHFLVLKHRFESKPV